MILELHRPIATDTLLERLNFLPGRALGEDELESEQAYLDARLRALVAAQHAGVVMGLHLRTDQPGQPGDAVTVAPGLAVGGDGTIVGLNQPLTVDWRDLIQGFLDAHPGTAPRGVYYLVLTRSNERVDVAQNVSPCRRFELDRYRDTRRVVVGRLALRRLMVDDALVLEPERAGNLVCAMHADGAFLDAYRGSVPLALMAVDGRPRINWLSVEAGRFLARLHSGYHVLHDHTARLLDDAAAAGSLVALFNRLRFLPAAGRLPREVLADLDTQAPGLRLLPAHLRVDAIPIRASQVDELVRRHLPRSLVDLQNTRSGDHLRLLLAVRDRFYADDLLDIPGIDAELFRDAYDAFVEAHKGWIDYKSQYYRVYSHQPLAPERVKELGLPAPLSQPQPLPEFHAALVAEAEAEFGARDHPYDEPLPAPSPAYRNYEAEHGGALPEPERPNQPGLVVRQALLVEELERLDNRIRAKRKHVEKLRDYQLLQRQQLDSITVSMASLAGGVSGDGSGLQVARWLPYTELKKSPEEDVIDRERAGSAGGPAGGGAPLFGGFTAGPVRSFAADTGSAFRATDVSARFSSTVARSLATTVARRQPVSTFELSLGAGLVGKLAEIPKKTLTAPAFVSQGKKFGVLEHIRPDLSEYQSAYDGMEDLLATLGEIFDRQQGAKLQRELVNLGKPERPLDIRGSDDKAVSRRYRAIFQAGRILTRRISHVEDLYAAQERQLEDLIRQRAGIEAQLEQLEQQVVSARARLANLVKTYEETLGDYGQIQRLLDEHLRNVRERFIERNRILTEEVVGLHYVRVQSAPLSARLRGGLAVRFDGENDVVPGCPRDPDVEVPHALQEFFDAMLELGLSDWERLEGLSHRLPAPQEFAVLGETKKLRLQQRVQRRKILPLRRAGKALAALSVTNEAILATLLNTRVLSDAGTKAKARAQKEAARAVSIQDVLGGGYGGYLRTRCEGLRRDLEQAVVCLLERISTLPPAQRFRWAQLAEDDALDVTDITRWPEFNRVRREDFLAGLAVRDLLQWWFRQLAGEHSSEALAAARNMIRAIVIHAALGEPEEILQGEVVVPPRVLDPGVLIRVKLNRPARLGTRLQLFDERKRAVALVQLEDEDSRGAVLSVVRTTSRVQVTRGFTVAATKALQWKL